MAKIERRLAGLLLVMSLLLGGGLHAQAQTFAPSFRLAGAVTTPQTYTLQKLQALPATKLDVFFVAGGATVNASYTGVLLWDLLTTAGVVSPAVKNGMLRQEVTVTGSDGYEAVFSLGELAPMFGGEQVIVAYLLNGAPVTDGTGFASIVVPGDKAGGRFVHAVTRIKVSGSPAN